jgi:hypothetical protein
MAAMAMAEAEIHLNVDAELANLALELGFMAEEGARILEKEMTSLIAISDLPSEPDMPPHSRGPYRNSWKAGKARRRGDSITAWSFSQATTKRGESLAEVLDEGRGKNQPRPHIRQAIRQARARLDAVVRQQNAGA